MSTPKKIGYDRILARMNLCIRDGKLHRMHSSDVPATTDNEPDSNDLPDPAPSLPEPTEEEKKEAAKQRVRAYREMVLQNQRRAYAINMAKSKKIKYINTYPASEVQHAPHTAETIFPLRR